MMKNKNRKQLLFLVLLFVSVSGFGQYYYNQGFVVTMTDKSEINTTFKKDSNNGIYWYSLKGKESEEILKSADNYYNYKFRFSKYVGNPDSNGLKIYFENISESAIEVLESPKPNSSLYTMESTSKIIESGKRRLTWLYFDKERFKAKAEKNEPYIFFVELRTKNNKGEYILYSVFFHLMMQQ